jgi:hypothetical protein
VRCGGAGFAFSVRIYLLGFGFLDLVVFWRLLLFVCCCFSLVCRCFLLFTCAFCFRSLFVRCFMIPLVFCFCSLFGVVVCFCCSFSAFSCFVSFCLLLCFPFQHCFPLLLLVCCYLLRRFSLSPASFPALFVC